MPTPLPAPSRAEIEARLARVNDEIKAYPQPIARCDAQLAGLLDERVALRQALEALARDG
jgi:chorismate mutase